MTEQTTTVNAWEPAHLDRAEFRWSTCWIGRSFPRSRPSTACCSSRDAPSSRPPDRSRSPASPCRLAARPGRSAPHPRSALRRHAVRRTPGAPPHQGQRASRSPGMFPLGVNRVNLGLGQSVRTVRSVVACRGAVYRRPWLGVSRVGYLIRLGSGMYPYNVFVFGSLSLLDWWLWR